MICFQNDKIIAVYTTHLLRFRFAICAPRSECRLMFLISIRIPGVIIQQ